MKYFLFSLFCTVMSFAMKEESPFSKVIRYEPEFKIDMNNFNQVIDEVEVLRDLISDLSQTILYKTNNTVIFLQNVKNTKIEFLKQEKELFYELSKNIILTQKENENLYRLLGLSKYLDELIENLKLKKSFIQDIICSDQNIGNFLNSYNKKSLSFSKQVINIQNISQKDEVIFIKEIKHHLNNPEKYKNLEIYIKKLIQKGQVNIKETVIKNLKGTEIYLFEKYRFLNEIDYEIIMESLLEESSFDYESIDKKCFSYMQKERAEIENKFQEDFFKNHNKRSGIIAQYQHDIYAPDHLVLDVSFMGKRKVDKEFFLKTFKEFLEHITKLELSLKKSMMESLIYLLNSDKIGDNFMRGFYASIFESNKTKEDIENVTTRFNEIEGCTDCAKLFAHTLKDLNRNNKEGMSFPGSLNALKDEIYEALYEKRLQIFNEYMIEKKIYPYTNEEQRYSYSILIEYFSELLGLNNISNQVWYSCEYGQLGKDIIRDQNDFIAHFFKEYNEDIIIKAAYETMEKGKYNKEVQRYIGMKKFFENCDIIPKYYEKDDEYIVEDTAYMDSKYQLTPLAIEETMITLFGFSNYIHNGF